MTTNRTFIQPTIAAHIHEGQPTLDREEQTEELYQKFALAFANFVHFAEYAVEYLWYSHRS